ncbi:MAG: DUF2281 domain-containing protein [Microcoleaceae cyanobacterium]
MIQPAILEKLEALPQSLQTEVLHYIEFLLEKHTEVNTASHQTFTGAKSEKLYGYGSMAGQIIMSDDFDEPLEELAGYM